MENDIKNLQNELLNLTRELIALKNSKPTDYSLVQSIRSQLEQLEKRADNHGARINILESVREVQKKLNMDILKKLEPKETPKTSFWFRK